MSKHVWLIWHGESQGNLERCVQGWADYPLTDLGRQQATRLAERLAREKTLRELVASPLQRAAETAQIISDALALPVRFDKCGFIKEGRLREEVYAEGRYRDMLVMGILKREFVEASSK
jgi:broad specificity phosphatase PhoE